MAPSINQAEMEPGPGTYALVLQSISTASIQVGCWGELELSPGYYIYLGSAFGSGGVRARVLRHSRTNKRMHWHIDYLRERVSFEWAWYSYEPVNLEHRWAKAMSDIEGVSPVKGFGCSDCKCYSHLLMTPDKPEIERFSSAIGLHVNTWFHQSA